MVSSGVQFHARAMYRQFSGRIAMGNVSSSRILKLDGKVELGKFPGPQGGMQTEIRHTGALGGMDTLRFDPRA